MEDANVIADLIGVYSSCKHSDSGKSGCEFSETKLVCYRSGFTMELEGRIRQVVKNDIKIEKLNISP
jgi:hypothetical protein